MPLFTAIVIFVVVGLVIPIFILRTLAPGIRFPRSKKPLFGHDPKPSPVESFLVKGILDELLQQQEQFHFDHREREFGYQQTGKAVADFFERGFITAKDLKRKKSTKLFACHRLLGSHQIDEGLLIRMTVNANLFGGCIANLGDKSQVQWLQSAFQRGETGCFMLTESGPGVLSGLIVKTTATWNQDQAIFTLHSPEPIQESQKFWVSQGKMATWGVVIANLIVSDHNHGPHCFIINMKSNGITIEDMPRKTNFNSLDNTYVRFDNVELPHDSLLRKISFINEKGEYTLVNEQKPFNFTHVSQRLLSGRICLSGYALGKIHKILQTAEKYAIQRTIPVMGSENTIPLRFLPAVGDLFDLYAAQWDILNTFVKLLEEDFQSSEMNPLLVHQIACAKAEVNEFCASAVHKLKNKLGSYSLIADGAFNFDTEVFQLIRFAEGDVGILQQKIARDYMKNLTTIKGILSEIISIPINLLRNPNSLGIHRFTLSTLALKLAFSLKNRSKEEMTQCWLESHQEVYRIARASALQTIFDKVTPHLRETKLINAWNELLDNIQAGCI